MPMIIVHRRPHILSTKTRQFTRWRKRVSQNVQGWVALKLEGKKARSLSSHANGSMSTLCEQSALMEKVLDEVE